MCILQGRRFLPDGRINPNNRKPEARGESRSSKFNFVDFPEKLVDFILLNYFREITGMYSDIWRTIYSIFD